MKTVEYISAVQKKLGIESDYGLQKPLAVSKQAISRYRNGHATFDQPVARRVALILGIEPAKVLADMEVERATDPDLAAVWKSIAKKVAVVVLAPLACGSLIAQSGDARANATTLHNQKFGSDATVIHIARFLRWLLGLPGFADGALPA